MNDTPVYLYICSSCAAYPSGSAWVSEGPQPWPYHCPRCQPGLMTAEEQLATHPGPYPVVSFIGDRLEARWVVLEILNDGGLRVRPVGLPDWPVRTRHTSEIRPLFSYDKLNRHRANRKA